MGSRSIQHDIRWRALTYNRILRDKLPKRLTATPRERNWLVRLGSKFGLVIKDPVSLVTPRTFARWVAGSGPGSRAKPASARRPGRPRTASATPFSPPLNAAGGVVIACRTHHPLEFGILAERVEIRIGIDQVEAEAGPESRRE